MNQILLLALAIGLVVAIEVASRIRSRLIHIRRTRRVSEALERLDQEGRLDQSQLQMLLDRHRFWVGRVTTCTSEPERDAVTRLARAELGPAAEILSRPEYDPIRRIKLDNLLDFDPELRRQVVSAVNAQVRLDRWRGDADVRSTRSPATGSTRPG